MNNEDVPAKKSHILIVDDQKNLCSLLSKYLESEGHFVSTSHNGKEARQEISFWSKTYCPIDLILTDYNMPVENGAQLIHQLDADGITLPTIVMSGTTGFRKEFKSCSSRRQIAFVTKPLNVIALPSLIRSMASKPRYFERTDHDNCFEESIS